MSETPRTVLLSCGEASGDLYLSHIAAALAERRPRWRLVGVTGPHSREAGVESWLDQQQLSVMGFSEVMRHLPRLRRLGHALVDRAVSEGVDLFLPVDYPGFHMRVAQRMRRAGIGVLDVIPPKTWSWGAWRLRSLPKAVDRCAVIFPFEEDYYRRAGVDAQFVGHPLMDLHGGRLPALEDDAGGEQSLLLVPGSRQQEIHRLTGPLVAALRGRPSSRVRISRAPGVPLAWLEPLRAGLGGAEIVEGPLIDELLTASAAIVCSGTASMETALVGCPHLIVYRTSPVTYAIGRAVASVEHIGMANIVLRRRAFPELLQGDCSADSIARGLRRIEHDKDERERQRSASRELRSMLAGRGCFDAVAEMAVEMLDSAS